MVRFSKATTFRKRPLIRNLRILECRFIRQEYGYVLSLNFKHGCFAFLKSRPCPCRYLTHLHAVCRHFISLLLLFKGRVACRIFALTLVIAWWYFQLGDLCSFALYHHWSVTDSCLCIGLTNTNIRIYNPQSLQWNNTFIVVDKKLCEKCLRITTGYISLVYVNYQLLRFKPRCTFSVNCFDITVMHELKRSESKVILKY